MNKRKMLKKKKNYKLAPVGIKKETSDNVILET